MKDRLPDHGPGYQADWSRVDDYFRQLFASDTPLLRKVLSQNAKAGLPAHDVSAMQGKFLSLLVLMTAARRVLEIGTLGAYSTIWIARALPENGRVVTLEADPVASKAARENLRCAGVAEKVHLVEGAALDTLPRIDGPFDLIFIDADKPNNPHYLEWALRLARPGTVIVGDNVVRGGAVADPHSGDPRVVGVRRFLELAAAEEKLDTVALQTVGEKGWDGFSLSVVRDT